VITVKKHKRGFGLEERTLIFAKKVVRLCKTLLGSPVNAVLINQLVRASGSVGANYREANDALSKRDFMHRIKITRKEAKESHYWLQLLLEINPKAEKQVHQLLQEVYELKKIFSAIIDKSS